MHEDDDKPLQSCSTDDSREQNDTNCSLSTREGNSINSHTRAHWEYLLYIDKIISSTSSTFDFLENVDGVNARRQEGVSPLSTLSTSFSKERVMWVRVRARAGAHSEPSPIREDGRRSRREGNSPTQSGENAVYFGKNSGVDGEVSQ